MQLKKENVEGVGFDLPITLEQDSDRYTVAVDGVVWVETTNEMHAVVMYYMMRENIADYVTYMPRR